MSQQYTDGNFIYFQYDTGDTPVGMLHNDRQYYYVTNQFGDVTAIIDDGYILCEGLSMKVFKFDYGNSLKFLASNLFAFLSNTAIWLLGSFAAFSLKISLTNVFNDSELSRKIFNIILFVLLSIFTILYILSFTIPKRVFLNSDHIYIRKNWINWIFIKRGINEKVLYQHIVSCRQYNGIYDNDVGPFYRRGKDYAVLYFERYSLVEIIDKFGRK